MSHWEDEEEDYGDVPRFDPAESAIKTDHPDKYLHTVLKRKFIEQYVNEHPGQIKDTEELYKLSIAKNYKVTEYYVERIIRHYYETDLPYEDDLESVDKHRFPSNKEIKRFLKISWYSIDWDAIDRYCGSQPTGESRKELLENLQTYFKLLKKKVLEYYPQIENFTARGFKELERSLYTINYILWTDLMEAVERHLGINKEHYEEMDRQLEKKQKEREERKKALKNKGEDWLSKWEKMTDEEKDEHEKKIEENEKLKERAIVFADKVVEEASRKFLELSPDLNIADDDFLAKAIHYCWRNYYETFYSINERAEHYKTSDELYKEKYTYSARFDEAPFFDVYKRMKEKNVPMAVETFIECLDKEGKEEVYFEIYREELGNLLLSNIYETFPTLLNSTPEAMKQIKNYAFGTSRHIVPELYDVCDRILKIDTKVYDDWDTRIEELQRKKFEGLE